MGRKETSKEVRQSIHDLVDASIGDLRGAVGRQEPEDEIVSLTTKRDPNTVIVYEDHAKTLRIEPGGKKTLISYGLGGLELFLLTEHFDGSWVATLAQCPLNESKEFSKAIDATIHNHVNFQGEAIDRSENIRHYVIFSAPMGLKTKVDTLDAIKILMEALDESQLKSLKKHGFWYRYSKDEFELDGAKKSFIVDFPGGGEPVYYKVHGDEAVGSIRPSFTVCADTNPTVAEQIGERGFLMVRPHKPGREKESPRQPEAGEKS